MPTHGAPLHPHFVDALAQGQMTDMSGLPLDAYMNTMNNMMKKNQAGFASNAAMQAAEYDIFGPDSALSTPTFMSFPEPSPAGSGQGWISEGETASTHTRRGSRRISGGIMDKVAKYESLANNMASRPATPPAQNVNGCFLPTPMETPHDRIMKHEPPPITQRPNRFSDDYDESMEETIKPMRGNQSNRNSGIFQDLRQQAEAMVQTPKRANTMPIGFPEQGLGTPGFMNMANVSAEFVKIENNFDGLNGFPSDLSSNASPMTPHMAGFAHGAFDNKPDFRAQGDFDSQGTLMPHGDACTPSHRGSPHRRTESLASIASAASIADINIEETKTDTGVTIDDIAAYIQGPDPSDGKWVCTYEDCLKRFGRKENIKSHVQTHLNDRQYQCPSCHKCFVRQHDLKRHAKIHTGIKPYPCECGNSFARHDALTRHRQRGMCIGAFDGIVRKVVKRGRPRKNRPDLDERREKSERTRRKNGPNKHTSSSSVSSFSGYSDSSAVNSPAPNHSFDLMDDDNDPFPDILDVAMTAGNPATTTATMNPSSLVSSAPMPRAESPSAMSNYSHASQAEQHYALPSNQPPSPTKSVASHYTHIPGTPPELSSSSSPPPTDHSAQYFDAAAGGNYMPGSDPNSSGLSDGSSSLGLGVSVSIAGQPGLVVGARQDGLPTMDDGDLSLLQFTTDEDGLVQLDPTACGALHMGGGKFEMEEYDAAAGMFTGEDLFFGSS
ncbi:hypothetical protein OQA88_9665 [Cercophora sp. LCS_1]